MPIEPKADPRYVGLGKVIALVAIMGALGTVILKALIYNVLELETPSWADPVVPGRVMLLWLVVGLATARRIWPSETARLLSRRRSPGW